MSIVFVLALLGFIIGFLSLILYYIFGGRAWYNRDIRYTHMDFKSSGAVVYFSRQTPKRQCDRKMLMIYSAPFH